MIHRITVVTRDRNGLMADLSSKLGEAGIDILSINAVEKDGNAYIRLEVDEYDKALAALRETEFQAVPEEVVLLRIDDEPGGLARISRRLADNDIGIRAMTMVDRSEGHCVVALHADDNEKAREVLGEAVLEV